MSNLQPVTEENFAEEVEKSDRPVVVDFWAEWCAPCKQLAPRLEELDRDYENVKFTAVDVDENQGLAQSFGVRSIPTLIFFNDGNKVHEQTGAVTKPSLRDAISEAFELPEEVS
ncbi:MAG: thioredoxin [bacterium]